jgi:hypothetical protein
MKPSAGQTLSNGSGGAWYVRALDSEREDDCNFTVELIARHHLEAGKHEQGFRLTRRQFEEFCRVEGIEG